MLWALIKPRLAAVLFVAVVSGAFTGLSAQDEFDTKGKEFWLAFLPNFHSRIISDLPELKYGDSLYIFITSEKRAAGKIEYFHADGTPEQYLFTVEPNTIHTFRLSYYDYEIRGFNDLTSVWERNECERPVKRGFHITSNEDVTVYALQQAFTTSDAYLALPADALGKNYFVMAYNSDGARGAASYKTPSQFIIAATENNTSVEIIPTAATYVHGIGPQSIILDKGECYLVQADLKTGPNACLTGTKITSDKTVAVFSGHQRATIPYDSDVQNPSRDMLIEQMPPLSTWGRNAFLGIFPQAVGATARTTDLYRIMSGGDNNRITIDGDTEIILSEGEYFEWHLSEPHYIESSGPILTAAFKKTSQSYNHDFPKISDPFMMIIPPKEQFQKSYKIINAQAMDYNLSSGKFEKVFQSHHITVIAPKSAVNTVKIDGAPADAGKFRGIKESGYVYGNFLVSAGPHEIEADEEIAVLVYGYGAANSYGYIGGMQMKKDDNSPPKIVNNLECFKSSGYVLESMEYDSGISEISIPEDSLINIRAFVQEFDSPSDSIYYTASLIDIYEDGFFTIIAKDSAGLENKMDAAIPGFTIAAAAEGFPGRFPDIRDSILVGREYCLELELYNYGSFRQETDSIYFLDGSSLKIEWNKFKYLYPGESRIIKACGIMEKVGRIEDTLIVKNKCGAFSIAAVSVEFLEDRSPPGISAVKDSCGRFATYTFTESKNYDHGIKKFKIIDSLNCRLIVTNRGGRKLSLELSARNPFKNAYYHIEVSDSSGNRAILKDTLFGFNLKLANYEDFPVSIQFGDVKIGDMHCRAVSLYNAGERAVELSSATPVKNIHFSAPQSQFPIVIEPGEIEKIELCFSPDIAREEPYLDSLLITAECLSVKLPLQGFGAEKDYRGEPRCSAPLLLSSREAPRNTGIAEVFPNPAGERLSVIFSPAPGAAAELKIFGPGGGLVLKNELGIFSKAGYYRINVSLAGLTSGVYYLAFISGRDVYTEKISIVK